MSQRKRLLTFVKGRTIADITECTRFGAHYFQLRDDKGLAFCEINAENMFDGEGNYFVESIEGMP